ncbi:LuxR C-terminal-related transcriptional regulator [Nocardia sp. AG03]|uniref:LuxR C-terminal-related transcriptional regulator n=1 Tax=Nocardia sp. AG03 TaxID=3025312 RepID=UPI00241887A5|nr:LuxR C-terminal-related transcriptional regulator [Nocardia sp. AG03]
MTTGDWHTRTTTTARALDELLDQIQQLGAYAERIRTSMIALEARERRHSAPERPVGSPRPPADTASTTPSASPTAHQHNAIRLTPRQRQVLDLLVQGCTNRRIGRVLDITEQTVKAHLYVLYQKLGAADRTEAVLIALRSGMARLPENGTEAAR